MIFVTVGTHEQPFDRLVKEIDRLKGAGIVRQEVFVQTGYSAYKPAYCRYEDFIPFAGMETRMAESEIVVTHGGTGSIMLILYHGKIPVVVPRQKKYREHVDDHQVLFCRTMELKKKIIPVYETGDLERVLRDYSRLARESRESVENGGAGETGGKAGLFAAKLHELCLELLNRKKK